MGLDIYVGPICRYHGGDWKTIVQQACEVSGIPVKMVWIDGEPDEAAPQDEILTAVRQWKANVNQGLKPDGSSVEKVDLSSLALLNEALDDLCARQQIDRGRLQAEAIDQPQPDAPLEEAALFATSIYCRLADEARRRNLPMLLDS